MSTAMAGRDDGARGLDHRNRRTAFLLAAWIAVLMIVSLVVIWMRN